MLACSFVTWCDKDILLPFLDWVLLQGKLQVTPPPQKKTKQQQQQQQKKKKNNHHIISHKIISIPEHFNIVKITTKSQQNDRKLTFSVSVASFSKNWTTQYANCKTKKEKKCWKTSTMY